MQAIVGLLTHLLEMLDALESIARRIHPPRLRALVAGLGTVETDLTNATAAFQQAAWPEHLRPFRDQATPAAELALRACAGLRAAASAPDPVRQTYRALRDYSRALEALYPLAPTLRSVSKFFLEPARHDDEQLLEALSTPAPGTGVVHTHNETSMRGGFSVYVPENRDSTRPLPLLMALHGGAGHGRLFLWNWVREARSRGVVVVAPTAIGGTWSLMEPDVDSANLTRILDQVTDRWHIDRTRLLLTGMSDGGTFTLISGLDEDSPFTHLAPVAASFQPMLLTMIDPRRVRGLPVYLVHGALDWMFPISVARTAERSLRASGAAVVYREIADLSHTYPRDVNAAMLDWFLG